MLKMRRFQKNPGDSLRGPFSNPAIFFGKLRKYLKDIVC
jgi:hypothetical protein